MLVERIHVLLKPPLDGCGIKFLPSVREKSGLGMLALPSQGHCEEINFLFRRTISEQFFKKIFYFRESGVGGGGERETQADTS